MSLQNFVFRKGRDVAGQRLLSSPNLRRHSLTVQVDGIRYHATDKTAETQLREELAREHVKELSDKQKAKRQARALDKDFFLSVLHSSATKRETKSYLQQFTPPKESHTPNSTQIIEPKQTPSKKSYSNGVNLGSFYGPAAVQESPKFVQQPYKQRRVSGAAQLHVALVKIRAPQNLGEDTLDGIGTTLSQLARLGLISVVVVDCDNGRTPGLDRKSDWRSLEARQAERIVVAIEKDGSIGARLVDNTIGVFDGFVPPGHTQVKAHVTLQSLLMTPLRRGIIPVIPSIGFTQIAQKSVPVPASDVILALTRELGGVPIDMPQGEDPSTIRDRLRALREEVSLDRLIIIDPLGGIPSGDQLNGYHVFLNLEQEFEPTKQNLMKSMGLTRASSGDVITKSENLFHVQNLQLARSVLSILPPSSSALLTTPKEAANSGKEVPVQATGVGTRRQKNPLIHNLLTDRPLFSSSLPMGRLGGKGVARTEALVENITPTTFAKHGMSVMIFPDPRKHPWGPPAPGIPNLTLTDSQICLPRLVHLIEDSFGRKLNVKEYLERVNHRIAGVIIAGEYEGGAILTWETPPGVIDDGSPESRARMVPYLDKFAVLKRKQGSATADLVFKAMVRDCFPQGVCWRSRKDNVVNKWYFERSRGTWKLPDTGWTMFWTTPDLSMDRQTFLDYEGVCRGIEPSWADNKSILD